MFRLATFVPALAALVVAQDVTTTYQPIATPDALPVADLRDIEVPTYTSAPGLDSDIVYYATATAIAAAAADQSESPLSVFPAVTAVPINAAGEDDSDGSEPAPSGTPAKRDLDKRAACAPQATISNFYKVNVDSYSAFKADPTISSVASAATAPAGYFNNFKNADGANSAYAYLGYAIVNSGKTGYDVNWCASKCSSISGCLSFNIYFERDPVLEPGTGCTNPAAFANLKCSFWGTGLDKTTANNYGQWRAQFQVAIAGSNAYTSYKLGGPIDGYSTPLSLDKAAMNAPLRDCAGTWTYLGYKLFQSGPYDSRLCSAACDAQTAYNIANPPVSGKPVKCAAFGSYILTMTNKTSSYQQGQMCTLYTSNWDKQYAVNTVSYDDGIGAKYTYSYSFFYSKPDVQPICKSDINYLISNGAEFCTSFNGYIAPLTTSTGTVTPEPSTSLTTATVSTVTVAGSGAPTTTVTADVQWRKRQDSPVESLQSLGTTYTTVGSVPAYSVVVLATHAETVTAENGTVPTNAPSNLVAAETIAARAAVPTPASISAWPSSRIAEACSEVATGTSTVLTTTTLDAARVASTASTTATTTLQACVVPSQNPDYYGFNNIWGSWDRDSLGDNPYPVYQTSWTLELPFPVKFGSASSSVVTVDSDGYLNIGGQVYLVAFAGQAGGLYIYPGKNGIFYRIAGPVGSRQVVFSWYAGTYNYGHMQNHFTITLFEDRPGEAQFKYYDVVQGGDVGTAYAAVISGESITYANQYQPFSAGDQYTLKAGSDDKVSVVKSTHNRVDCCVKNAGWWGGWHSCTEFQAAK